MNTPACPDSGQHALPVYPFSALHGQARLQLALLLVGVDPRIGGVLIEGARGTAKTTSARALADILPAGEFVNLPLGSSEEQLVGSLDLELVLQQGKTAFRPGLLARAHRGVLYVDEINLLADTLVDLLLDVCGSGINRVERDGLSHQHAADVVLVGTMNPEEGELRPQLLDRFGLYVSVDETMGLGLRQSIVRSRLAFDEDPQAFVREYADQQQALVEQLSRARRQLADIRFRDEHHDQVSRLCHEAAVDGVRADLVMLRASRAMAALQGRQEILASDIEAVAELVLAHRRQEPGNASPGNAAGSATNSAQSSQQPDSVTASKAPAGHAEETAESQLGDGASASREPSTASRAGHDSGSESSTSGQQTLAAGEAEQEGAGHPGSAGDSSGSGQSSDAQWGAMPAGQAQAVPLMPVNLPGGIGAKKR